jgi:hypothetical protein
MSGERYVGLGNAGGDGWVPADAANRALDERDAALAEVEKWKARTRAGVTTPPPGYESGYVEMRRFRAVCAERDAALAEVEKARADERAKVVSEVVEWLREHGALQGRGLGQNTWYTIADLIEARFAPGTEDDR